MNALYRTPQVRASVRVGPPTTRFDLIGALTHERPYKPHLGGLEPGASQLVSLGRPNGEIQR